jgi:hypothetical protein
MRKIIFLAITGFMVSSTVFATWPTGKKPVTEPRTPVDAPHAKGHHSDNGKSFEVSIAVDNRNSPTSKNCDFYTTLIGKHPSGNRMQVEAFNTVLLKGARKATMTVTYDQSEIGQDYLFIKESLRSDASCLEDVKENSGKEPHTSCDPSEEKCGWTCQSSQQKPEECASPTQDWSPSQKNWL